MSLPSAPTVRVEDYSRAVHGDGPARVVEAVYREYGFTWEPAGYHDDVVRPEDHYRSPHAFFAVAVDPEGRVIGTVGGALHGDEAELKRLYLLADRRGQGIGRLLLFRFLMWARSRGASRAVAWSDKRFADAHRLYAAAGFSVTGSRICPGDPDASPEFGYTLTLR